MSCILIKILAQCIILNACNISLFFSPYTGHPYNFEKLLGGIKRNESGHIIAAESVISFWMVDVDFTSVDMDQVGNSLGTADWATLPVLEWEQEFISVMESSKKNLIGIELLYSAERR